MTRKTHTLEAASPKKAVLYLRVSSTAQTKTATDIDKDGNSIATQREYGLQKALELNAEVVEEFVEPGVSAQTITNRKAFRSMLTYLKENPGIDYVIIYARSRAFRNFTDAAITRRSLEEMCIKLISVREDFGEGVYADAMEAFTDIMNQVQNQLSGEDIKLKMRNKAKNGGTIGKAKLGYLNVRKDVDGYLVNTIALDSERAPLVRQAFELYATGEYTLEQLCEEMDDRGLRTKPTPKRPAAPLSRSYIHRFLKDPYYTGVVTYKGEIFAGRHEPIIPQELFDRVQEVMSDRSGSGTKERTHLHYLRGLMRCMNCAQQGKESRLIFTESVGRRGDRHQYYFCVERQQRRTCDLPFLPVWLIEERMIDVLDQVKITEDFASDITTHLDDALANEQGSLQIALQQLERELVGVVTQEERLVDMIADGLLTKEVAQKKLNDIANKKNSIQQRLDQNQEKLSQGVVVFKDLAQLMLTPKEHYRSATDEFRRTALQTYFHHINVGDDGIYTGQIREPFASIRRANDIFTFPQTSGENAVSADRPGACPPVENVHLANVTKWVQKTAQNAVSGVPDGTFGQTENDAENSTSPLLSSLLTFYSDGGSNKTCMVEVRGFEPLTFCMPCRRATNCAIPPKGLLP